MNSINLEKAKNIFFILLGIDIAINLINLFLTGNLLGILTGIKDGTLSPSNDLVEKLGFYEKFSYLSVVSAIGVGITLVAWLKGSYRFIREALMLEGIKWDGWTAWGWIVPIIGIFRPYQIMAEIYRCGSARYTGRDDWQKESTSAWLLFWWIFWLIAHMIMWASFKSAMEMGHSDVTLQQSTFYTQLGMFTTVLGLVVAVLWFFVAHSLTSRLIQREDRLPQGASFQKDAQTPAFAPPSLRKNNQDFKKSEIDQNSNLLPTYKVESPIARESQSMTSAPLSEEHFYEVVADELESGNTKKGLWMKAFADASGDDKQTKLAYIRLRVAQLEAEEKENIRQQIAQENEMRLLDEKKKAQEICERLRIESSQKLVDYLSKIDFSSGMDSINELMKLADSGYARAQFTLGILHLKGERVALDFSSGYKYIATAAKQGHLAAQELMLILNPIIQNPNGTQA